MQLFLQAVFLERFERDRLSAIPGATVPFSTSAGMRILYVNDDESSMDDSEFTNYGSCYPVAFNAFGMLFAYSFADHPPDMHVHIVIEMMRR